ncbi:MAG: glycosyl transferase family 1 [Pirellulaceae bacterium]|nr:MAG: glycosyl transferase family 1 [Pirellulaceae bacterium]GIW95275.1 MAG: glycosyl transferase family 1 [Pirellulaceae bacterium]
MFCGSCMHDNTLARALNRIEGIECLLIPTYTPIRTDEENVSIDRVFLGGITVYLEERFAPLRYAPRWLTRWLDQPWLIRWLAKRAVKTDPSVLGSLTVSLLHGREGHQKRDIEELAQWLAAHVRPDRIVLSNMLIGGCIPALKEAVGCPLWVTLQGDDIFLDELHEPYRSEAIQQIRRLVPLCDGFLVNSRYYADYMGPWFGIEPAKLHQLPLCIDPAGLPEPSATAGTPAPSATIGYLARLAPEKGLHLLIDAFLRLKQNPETSKLQLRIAGWLGPQHKAYFADQMAKIRAHGCEKDVCYVGEVDRHGKAEFLKRTDILCVPTVYPDPKGLFVLEAWVAGIPVVQPEHGAFPELVAATGGGMLVPPHDADALSQALGKVLRELDHWRQKARAASDYVRREWNCNAVARRLVELLAPPQTSS